MVYPFDLRTLFTDYPTASCVRVQCIYHDGDRTPSLMVYPTNAVCFGCGRWVPQVRFVADYLRLSYRDALTLVRQRRRVAVPRPAATTRHCADEALLLARRCNAAARLDYWRSRCLSPDTVAAALLGYDDAHNAHTIPVFAGNGVMGIKYRRADYGEPKYFWNRHYEKPLLYVPPTIPTSPIAVLVEGELDALLLAQYGVPALSPTGGSRTLARAAVHAATMYRGLILLPDNDGAGWQAAADAVAALRGAAWVAVVIHDWGKDATDVFRNGDGDRLLDRLRDVYRVAKGVVRVQ